MDTTTLPAHGAHPGVPDEDYRAWPAWNYSRIKLTDKSMAHVKNYPAVPPETEAMRFGKAFHAAVLEPGRFFDAYAVAPKVDRRTTAGKAAYAEFVAKHSGKTILDSDDCDTIQGMASALAAHPLVGGMLKASGQAELSCLWTDPDTALDCKCRLDWMLDADILDLKTTDDASPSGFARSIAKYGYHRQATFYSDGALAAMGRQRGFVIVAVEKEPPHFIGVYRLSKESREVGREQNRVALHRIRACVDSGQWPGYSNDEIASIGLPAWAAQDWIES